MTGLKDGRWSWFAYLPDPTGEIYKLLYCKAIRYSGSLVDYNTGWGTDQ